MEHNIVRPDGTLYMTVVDGGSVIEFRHFGQYGHTVRFDKKVLDELINALQNIKLVNWMEQ